MQPVAPASTEPPRPAFTADDVRYKVPAQIRNVDFPVSVRGYDRDAVEAYVRRVNQVIAELEISRSPEAAVRHALDRVGKQTIAVLQEARESADKLMAAAREEADEALARAKTEAANLVVNSSADADQTKAEAERVLASAKAEAEQILAKTRSEADAHRQQAEAQIAALHHEADERMRDLQADTDVVWKERDRLLEETHAMANRLQELAASAGARQERQAAPAPAAPSSRKP
jgi:DivIVA domain-containing protein